jgi:hypothetical protein
MERRNYKELQGITRHYNELESGPPYRGLAARPPEPEILTSFDKFNDLTAARGVEFPSRYYTR